MNNETVTLTKKEGDIIMANASNKYDLSGSDKIDATIDKDLELTLIARETALFVFENYTIEENSFVLVLVPKDLTFLNISVGLIKTGVSENKLTYGVMYK